MNLEFNQPFEKQPTFRAPAYSEWVLDDTSNGAVWFVDDVQVTPEVPAGGIVDVALTIRNERQFISPLHPNICAEGLFSGLEAKVTVDPTWATPESQTVCTGIGEVGIPEDDLTFDFRAPDQPGSYAVDIEVVGTGDGSGGTVTFEVLVPEDDAGLGGRPGSGGGRGAVDDENGDDGGAGLPQIPGGLTGGLAILVVILVLLLYVGVAV